jgi:hypothetical protein
MDRRIAWIFGAVVFAAPLAGCDIQRSSRQLSQPAGTALPTDSAAAVPETPPQPVATEVVPAEAGVGAQGRNYGGGLVSEPIRQRFLLEQRIIFLQVEHALELHNALNGSYPQTHEQFMQDIIATNGIALPELPPDNEYFYDPATHQLMVRRPGEAGVPTVVAE